MTLRTQLAEFDSLVCRRPFEPRSRGTLRQGGVVYNYPLRCARSVK